MICAKLYHPVPAEDRLVLFYGCGQAAAKGEY